MALINITGCGVVMGSIETLAVGSVAAAIGSEPSWSAAEFAGLGSAAVAVGAIATASSAFVERGDLPVPLESWIPFAIATAAIAVGAVVRVAT